MSVLLSIKELEQLLAQLGMSPYYIDIDMNGAMELSLPPAYEEKAEQLHKAIVELDQKRTPDDIYDLKETLYPFQPIFFDDDVDSIKIERSYYSQQLNTWLHAKQIKDEDPSRQRHRPKRVTFYSYKGGVGRSTALAIVARLLAQKGLTVAVIDLDLEAPGLNSLLLTSPKTSPFGVVDYLYHVPWLRDSLDKERFTEQYLVREEVRNPNTGTKGQIYVMSAGGTVVENAEQHKNLLFEGEAKVDITLVPGYLQKLGYIDFDLYARTSYNAFEALLEDVETYTEADIILLDARTGISNVSGALLRQCSDVVSVHIQQNKQNREGIKFILENVQDKQPHNMIWSHTKIPRHHERTDELKNFIKAETKKHLDRVDERFEPDFFYLPYDSDIEDATAHELKQLVDKDRIPIAYKALHDQIIASTQLDHLLSDYISSEDRKHLLDGFSVLKKRQETIPYISPRFLNEGLKIFVGFPGSGKKTFADYMQETYGKTVTVMDYEAFIESGQGTHKILTNTIFLDWTQEEAEQAICKWALQSETFFKWLTTKRRFANLAAKISLPDEVIKNPEYQLPTEMVQSILQLLFDSDLFRFGLETRLQYRRGRFLPADLMAGVQAYIDYVVEQSKEEADHTQVAQDSLFPTYNVLFNRDVYKHIWREIGEQKARWLATNNHNVLLLLKAFRSIADEFALLYSYPLDEAKTVMMEQLHGQLTQEEFDQAFAKALHMGIFFISKDHTGKERLILSPVYVFIPSE